jgi:hypothetical protein
MGPNQKVKVVCKSSTALHNMPARLIIAEDAVLEVCDTVGTVHRTAQHHTARDLHLKQHPRSDVMTPIALMGKSINPYVQSLVQLMV